MKFNQLLKTKNFEIKEFAPNHLVFVYPALHFDGQIKSTVMRCETIGEIQNLIAELKIKNIAKDNKEALKKWPEYQALIAQVTDEALASIIEERLRKSGALRLFNILNKTSFVTQAEADKYCEA